jgi:NAD-dependent SIR2 family protein deacetylase
VLSEREEINLLDTHNWLPDQTAHFRNVRCIECHSEVNDSILVSHLINPREKAVKKCNECHSRNSLLMSSLYKFKSKEQRKGGFFNGIILNESFVIGANRNEYLNIISIALFAVLILVIGTHSFFRIFKK